MNTIEEKARKYNEALEKVKGLLTNAKKQGHIIVRIEDLENTFPELKEFEDEKIRKTLIAYFNTFVGDYYGELKRKDILAWLEKQGEHAIACSEEQMKVLNEVLTFAANHESPYWNDYIFETLNNLIRQLKKLKNQDEQKPADKVEPKFNGGDWIVNKHGEAFLIGYIDKKNARYVFEIGGYSKQAQNYETIEFADKHYHLWTIADARDGDVLVYGDNPSDHHVEVIMIFKSLRNEKFVFTHFHIFNEQFRVNDWCDCGISAHPATKEQRDLLFQKMYEAGYEWNAEKKELKKIEQKLQRMVSAEAKEALYDKPTDKDMKEVLRTEYEKGRADAITEMKIAWSEEDERMCQAILNEYKSMENTKRNWLKSLKDRVQPQKQWKPSKEQLTTLLNASNGCYLNGKEQIVLRDLYSELTKS